MKHTLLLATALWVFLLSPGFCLAGAIEHVCADCPQGISCGHEEDCGADPCGEPVLRIDPHTDVCAPALLPALDPDSVSPGTVSAAALCFPCRPPSPSSDNLPCPDSDLPLLN